jgi:hypothetical protein
MMFLLLSVRSCSDLCPTVRLWKAVCPYYVISDHACSLRTLGTDKYS